MSKEVLGRYATGSGRILLSAAALASLGLEEAVVGSDVIMGLWDHCHVQFFLREWWPCPLLFFLSQGWWPLPGSFLTMSFAGLVAFARIRTLFLLLGVFVLPSRKAALESWMVGLYAGSPA